MTSGNKTCIDCKKSKLITEFHGKYFRKCKICRNKDKMIQYYLNQEQEIKKSKNWREKNKDYKLKYDRNVKNKELENLDDNYIKQLLRKKYKSIEISYKMIKEKRDFIINKRINSFRPKGEVYIISDGRYVKIGFTSNYKDRLPKLQCGNPNKLKKITVIKNKTEQEEKKLHRNLKNNHSDLYVRGEWYDKKILQHYNKYIGE
tara:strand:+ start:1684 stop:2292 length:609 start_codon:yes stop_codon:yes gene_type:complete